MPCSFFRVEFTASLPATETPSGSCGSGGTHRTYPNIAEPFGFYKRVQEQVALAQKKV
jgi:hypothetical protein